MKKTRFIRNNFFKLSLIAGLFILNSCGLDEYYVVEPPVLTGDRAAPEYNPDSPLSYDQRYFEFKTNSNSGLDGSGCEFLGTEVYYKIYNNYNTCINQKSYLNSLVNSETTKGNSFSILTNTTYNFQKLKISGDSAEPVVRPNEHYVRIRLTQYYDAAEYKSEFSIGTQILDGGIVYRNRGVPVRSSVSGGMFDFSRNSTSYPEFKAPVPVSDDADFNSGTATKDGIYYVTMYAVSVAQDATFTQYYSPILYLGTVGIDAASYDN